MGREKENETKISRGRYRTMKNRTKKHTLIVAALAAFSLTIIILSAIDIYIQLWEPFEEINLTKNGDTQIIVKMKTKVPVSTSVECGTDPSAMLKKNTETQEYKEEHTFKIAHVLPQKEHFVRITATTEDGKEFKSDYLRVK